MTKPTRSRLEERFLTQWTIRYPLLPPVEQFTLPGWKDWHLLHKRRGRAMACDFAWPDALVALEIEGGTWSRRRSGHSSGKGIQRDILKANLALGCGWSLYRLDSTMLEREEEVWFPRLAALICARLPDAP